MMENHNSLTNYYVDMSYKKKETLESQLAESFKLQFRGELKVFSCTGILNELGIHDEDLDALETIHKILQKLPRDTTEQQQNNRTRTTILFDETPIERSRGSFDWSNLKNERNDVLALVAFQPMLESSKGNTRPIKPLFPAKASKAELTKVYRISKSIFQSLESIQWMNGIKRIDSEATSLDSVIGKKPEILTYRPKEIKEELRITLLDLIRGWIQKKLDSLKCSVNQVSVLYTKNTKKDNETIFGNLYQNEMPQQFLWDEYRGCENSVVICLFSSKEMID